jgi:hypothetical protein
MFGSRRRDTDDNGDVVGFGRCDRHQFNEAVARCARCNASFCTECFVYPFGRKRPPLCVPCALVAGGVRRG